MPERAAPVGRSGFVVVGITLPIFVRRVPRVAQRAAVGKQAKRLCRVLQPVAGDGKEPRQLRLFERRGRLPRRSRGTWTTSSSATAQGRSAIDGSSLISVDRTPAAASRSTSAAWAQLRLRGRDSRCAGREGSIKVGQLGRFGQRLIKQKTIRRQPIEPWRGDRRVAVAAKLADVQAINHQANDIHAERADRERWMWLDAILKPPAHNKRAFGTWSSRIATARRRPADQRECKGPFG